MVTFLGVHVDSKVQKMHENSKRCTLPICKPLIEDGEFARVGSSKTSVAFTEASRGLAGPLPKFAWREAIDSAQQHRHCGRL